MMPLDKTMPAFDGAKFNSKGFCIVHPDIRLCQLASGGKYKVVRKTCFKCGSAALMTEPHTVKTNPHGYPKKPAAQRVVPNVIAPAETTANRRSRTPVRKRYDRHPSRGSRGSSDGGHKRERMADKIAAEALAAKIAAEITAEITAEILAAKPTRRSRSNSNPAFERFLRSRTLSPLPRNTRRGRSRTLSPSRKVLKNRSRTLSPPVIRPHHSPLVKQDPPTANHAAHKEYRKSRSKHHNKHATTAIREPQNHKSVTKNDDCPLCSAHKENTKAQRSSKSPPTPREKKPSKSAPTARKPEKRSKRVPTYYSGTEKLLRITAGEVVETDSSSDSSSGAPHIQNTKMYSNKHIPKPAADKSSDNSSDDSSGGLDVTIKRSNIASDSPPTSPKPKKREPVKISARQIEKAMVRNYGRLRW